MPNSETVAIVASTRQVPVYTINAPIQIAKDEALAKSGLIGAVTGHDSKIVAVRAQKEIKSIISAVEHARVDAKEPLLIAGRQLDSSCKLFVLDLEKEFGRISEIVRVFDDEERKRVRDEQRLQELELQRIQREKDVEIERLRQEQLAKEAEARRIIAEAAKKATEEREAAERLAAEAKTEKERKMAQEAFVVAEASRRLAEEENARQAAATAQQQAELSARTAQIEEKASDAAYISSKPIGITKVAGQITRPTWKIDKINDHQLYRARPDLVTKFEWDMRALKAELARGIKLPGVEAHEEHIASVRAGRLDEAIDITP